MKKLIPLGFALLLALSSACRKDAATSAGGAAPGRLRVVSLAPNLTEIICAIGAADLLVGRTNTCDYPPEIVRRVPVVGGFGEPSLEQLLAVKANLVFDVDLADNVIGRKIENLGIRRKRITCNTLDSIPAAMLEIGRCLDREAGARQAADRFRTELARLRREQPAGETRPLVFAEIWPDPVMTAGRNSLVSELVTLAGGRNLGDELAQEYAQVSTEWIVSRDPEVVFCFYDAKDADVQGASRQRTGWNTTRAVRNGRVYSGFDINLMLKPGPRVLQGVPLLRNCLQPKPLPKET